MENAIGSTEREVRGVLGKGTRLRNYEIHGVLGQGSFGVTYLAEDITLARMVAVKEYAPMMLALRDAGGSIVPRSTQFAEEFLWGRERFLDEARILARLDSVPSIVRVYEFLEANGTAYMVMALVDGHTLDDRLRTVGPMEYLEIERFLPALLDGLQEVHAHGYLHRDIKPSNIILDASGSATLIDFGASRAALAGRTATMTAVFTPGYAAPEQLVSAKQGPWTDIYSLSATLYQAITGKVPPAAYERVLEDLYEPLAQVQPPGFPPDFLSGIDAGLAIRVDARPADIAEWRRLLPGVANIPSDRTRFLARLWGPSLLARPARRPSSQLRLPASVSTKPLKALGIARRKASATKARIAMAVLGAAAVFAGSAGYILWHSKSPGASIDVRTYTAVELAKALEERRKADALAAEKKRLEDEAKQKAAADAEAKRQADSALASAQAQRQRAEQDLERLKAEILARKEEEARQRAQAAAAAQQALDEAQRKNEAEAQIAALRDAEANARKKAEAYAAAQRLKDDEAQRKAEAEAAASRQAELEAQQKAAAEAEAKKRADDALAKAEADRLRAEQEAARRNADLAAQQKVQIDSKAESVKVAEARKEAQAAEASLGLKGVDQQRIQVALTFLGFDTKGSDGTFGPRTREMVAAWQRSRAETPTGFLNAMQRAVLLEQAAEAVRRFDSQRTSPPASSRLATEAPQRPTNESGGFLDRFSK